MAEDGKVVIETDLDDSGLVRGMKGAGEKVGSMAKGIATGAIKAVSAVGTATAVVAGKAVSLYSDYEQLTGGIGTLFKDSYGKVMKYADDAYKSSGLSANQYMETVTGFSATLLQGLGGDTEKAADIANMAVVDMSDNANKLGTDVTSIQNAYQGFAKQNYTMLDNLRIGYGGTASEMARLINDSGILGDSVEVTAETVKNVPFDQVIQAIHIIQQNLGITGTTAEEAATTIQGSFSMMKASWDNLLTGAADDTQNFEDLVQNFVDSLAIFADNIAPRFEIALEGVGKLIEAFVPILVEEIPYIIEEFLPNLLEAGANILMAILQGIVENKEALAEGIGQFIVQIGETITELLPMIVEVGFLLLETIITGALEALPELIPNIVEMVMGIADLLIENLPLILEVGMQFASELFLGIAQALPDLMPQLVELTNQIYMTFVDNAPMLLDAGLQLMLALLQGIIQSIPEMVAHMPEIVLALIDAIIQMIPEMEKAGLDLILSFFDYSPEMSDSLWSAMSGLVGGMIEKIADFSISIADAGKNLVSGLWDGICSLEDWLEEKVGGFIEDAVDNAVDFGSELVDAGENLIDGLWNGICNASDWLFDKVEGFCQDIVDDIEWFFGISSPAKKHMPFIGKMMGKGMGVGFEEEDPMGQINSSLKNGTDKIEASIAFDSSNMLKGLYGRKQGGDIIQNINIQKEVRSASEIAREIRDESVFGIKYGIIG